MGGLSALVSKANERLEQCLLQLLEKLVIYCLTSGDLGNYFLKCLCHYLIVPEANEVKSRTENTKFSLYSPVALIW